MANIIEKLNEATSTLKPKGRAAAYRAGMNVFNIGAKLGEFGVVLPTQPMNPNQFGQNEK